MIERRSRGATFSCATVAPDRSTGLLLIRDGSWDAVTVVHELAHLATLAPTARCRAGPRADVRRRAGRAVAAAPRASTPTARCAPLSTHVTCRDAELAVRDRIERVDLDPLASTPDRTAARRAATGRRRCAAPSIVAAVASTPGRSDLASSHSREAEVHDVADHRVLEPFGRADEPGDDLARGDPDPGASSPSVIVELAGQRLGGAERPLGVVGLVLRRRRTGTARRHPRTC